MEDLKLEDDFAGDSVPLAFGVGPLPQMLLTRSLGLGPSRGRKGHTPRASGADEVAEERLISRPEFAVTPCRLASQNLPPPLLGYVQGPLAMQSASTRSTFLMVFSPDKELIASTHGDHNIYISKVKTGDCVRVLQGHPRTPWCVAFHPSHKGVLASGCLGGHVRVWDLHGGSEVWCTEGVIASLAFHPVDRLLVVATFNELHFWDWSRPEPFTKVKTRNEKEKVRYVQFDSLGHQLITGIANLSQHHQQLNGSVGEPQRVLLRNQASSSSSSPQSQYEERRSRIMDRYERIMQQYNSFAESEATRVRRNSHYQTMDRGTDPIVTSTARVTTAPTTSTPVTVQNSASQTLSDLAQAATNQLMAENNANSFAMNTSSRDSSLERDDPLLSDHPYGLAPREPFLGSSASAASSRSRLLINRQPRTPDWSPSTSPPRTDAAIAAARLSRARERSDTDHSYYRRELRERMMELSRHSQQMRRQHINSMYGDLMGNSREATPGEDTRPRTPPSFSHSPESEFVEVTRMHPASRLNIEVVRRTEMFSNPERSPAGTANVRFRSQRDRRLRELLDRRQTLVSQIEHLRSARELLFPAEASSVPSTTLPSGSGTASASAAAGSASATSTSASASATASQTSSSTTNGDHNYGIRPVGEWAINRRLSLESHRLSRTLPEAEHGPMRYSIFANSILSERSSLMRDNLLREIPGDRRPRRGSTEMNPAILNETDVATLTGSVVEPDAITPGPSSSATEERGEASQPNDSSTRDLVSSNSDRQNLDIVLLSRHIDHMQQICRASLSDLAVTRQRRQIVRLQSIRRMLEDLQRQIRSLRAASIEELNRRTREAESLSSALGSVAGRRSLQSPEENVAGPSTPSTSSTAMTRQRATAALCRLRRPSGRSSASLRSSSSTANGDTAVSNSTSSSPGLRSSRARLTRAHTQLVSQLRATFRAMEMSPDLARQKNNPLNRSKAEASQAVMEQTEANNGNGSEISGGSTRNELRALSQRLERMLRERREAHESMPSSSAMEPADMDDDDSMSRRTALLREMNIPRPDPNPDYSHRWRHLLVGTPEYDRYAPSSSRRLRGRSGSRELHPDNLSMYLDSSSESDSESSDHSGDPFSLHGGRIVTAGRWTRYDFPSPAAEFPGTSSASLSPVRRTLDARSSRESWRASMRERLDIRAGLRRDAERERERRRLSRGRDISRRRRRYERYLGDLDVLAYPAREVYGGTGETSSSFTSSDMPASDASGARLPPLRELIWRRLRRRNAQLNLLDDEIGAETGQQRDRSRHREMLSWMVDQLTIDQQQAASTSASTGTQPGANRRNEPSSTRSSPSGSTTAATGSASASNRPLPNDPVLRQRYLILRDPDGAGMAPYQRDNFFLHHTPSNMLLTHRIQAWDFVKGDIPDIGDYTCNVVVKEAKIHNDASVDISEDGTILVTLVPSNLPMTTVVGVYSLSRQNRGTCYATYSLESSAVSVSLSPTTRHLLVGLTTRAARISLSPADRSLMAQVFRIKMPWEWNGERGRLIHRRDIPQSEHGQTALNCIRWIPVAGQGIVYATNTGLLKILR